MNKEQEYFAFISYKREDQKWAKWLQDTLENYKLPSVLNGRTDLPKEIRPVFRDKSELASGVLADEIQTALKQSKYLIVICSPRSAQSEWVNKEIQSFIDLGRTEKIIPFIIEGRPHAQNPDEECFPSLLRNLPPEQELLGIEVDEMGRDAAAVKVVAQMFGLQFDSLWQRHERQQKRRRNWAMCVIAAFALLVMGVAGWIWHQNKMLKDTHREMMVSHAKLVAKEVMANAKTDSYLSRIIALNFLSDNYYNKNENIVPEFESALRTASIYNSAVLIGHSAAITSTCFSPDGKFVLSSSFDNTIKLWDASNGICLKTFNGHTDRVYKAVFCSDLSKIASCSKDNSIKIWDVKSSNNINTLLGHEDAVYSVAFSPDGKHVLSSSEDKTIRIWDVETGECLNTLKGHNGMVECSLYSPTGDIIASCSEDSTIKLWDANSGICTKTLFGHKGAVQSVEFSLDGQYIVSASRDSTVKIWNTDSGHCIRTLTGHSNGVQYASFSNNGKLVASSSDDATTRIWEVSSGNCIDILKGHTIYATSPHFSPDSKRIVTGSVDWTVRIWDVGIKKEGKQLDIKSVNRKPRFSPDGHQITFISNDSIWIYDVSSEKKLNSIKNNKNGYIDAFFDTNGDFYAISVDYDTILVWNSESNSWDAKIINADKISAIDLCPEKKQIAIASDSGLIVIWDMVTGNKTNAIKAKSINDISFSFDGNSIILTSNDDIIRIYDINKSNCLCELNTQNTAKNNVIINHSKTEVITCNNNNIYVWDIKTGKAIRSFLGHTARVYGFTLSDDDKYLITVSHDNTIKIWDYKSGICVQSIIDEQHQFVSYSPDERHFATVSFDYGKIKIWPFPPLQDLIDQTRERFKDRPLTAEERKMYYLE